MFPESLETKLAQNKFIKPQNPLPNPQLIHKPEKNKKNT